MKKRNNQKELVDGASICVELWSAESQSQKVWKKNWLKRAEEALK